MQPVFEAMGKTIVHQGGPGAGQHTKMVNQILISSNMIAVCEGLLYGYKAGLDLETVFKSVSVGAAGSKALEVLGPRMHGRGTSSRASTSSTSSRTWASPWPRRRR